MKQTTNTTARAFEALKKSEISAIVSEISKFNSIREIKEHRDEIKAAHNLTDAAYRELLKTAKDAIKEEIQKRVDKASHLLAYENILQVAFDSLRGSKDFSYLCNRVSLEFKTASEFVQRFYTYVDGSDPLAIANVYDVEASLIYSYFVPKRLESGATALAILKASLSNFGRVIKGAYNPKGYQFLNNHIAGTIVAVYKAEVCKDETVKKGERVENFPSLTADKLEGLIRLSDYNREICK